MKKTLITLCATALTAVAANAQAVLGYTLSETEGTYTPLAGATVIYTGTDEATDIGWYDRSIITPEGITSDGDAAKGFELGFTLNLAGSEYTHFLVSPLGYLYLGGEDDIEYNTFMRANFLTFYYEGGLVGLACAESVGHLDETEISYKVNGSGADASVTMQFSNLLCQFSSWGEGSGLVTDLQYTITADGKVTYVFNDFRPYITEEEADDYEEPYSVPLRLAVRNGDFVCAQGELGELGVSQNVTEDVLFGTAVKAGTTVTWNIPGDCVTPTEQPSGLTFERTSDRLDYEFTPIENSETYLVVYTVGDAKPGTPVDGTLYGEGDKLGDATVVYYGDRTAGTVYDMAPGTDYNFYVYAVGSYGLNGPKYNVVEPLTAAVSTLPAAPGEVTFAPAAADSITFTVKENGTDDDILVIYNSYCERSNYGDHGLYGPITPELKAGDVLPVPEDFEPAYNYEGAPEPENGGTVAYVGKPGEVTIEGLDASTMYYISVYTRNAKGEYTSEPTHTGWSTVLSYPYDGDSYNYPNYQVPYGWESSDMEDDNLMVTDEAYYDRFSGEPTRGDQIMQIRVINNRGDGINGKRAWITPAPIFVNDRHVMATFSYSIVEAASRFSSGPYNDWAEDDKLEIQVSTDGGETWTTLTTYNAENHPEQAEMTDYNDISADLNDYRGETVLVRLYWDTYMAPAFGGNMYMQRFSLTQAEFPAVPVVTVGAVTDETAVINWVSQQTDYELVYSLKDSDEETVVKVENALTYTIEGLEANTEYTVKVRGVLVNEETGAEEGYSEWSDSVDFTTADYPEVAAPVGLVSDVESKGLEGVAVLSWDAIDSALEYEVAYRLSSDTNWTYVNCDESTVEVSDLELGASYIWKVRAFCTHDRETVYSAQANFTMPEDPDAAVLSVNGNLKVSSVAGKVMVNGAAGEEISIYSASGMKAAGVKMATDCEAIALQPGAYIVRIAGKSFKLIVR